MDAGTTRLRADVETRLWPLLEALVGTHEVAGLAVAVVREGEVVAQGFGVRDVRTGGPVTRETMFHLASVSKPFVATAVVSLAVPRDGVDPVLDLDAPVVDRIPELTLADGREAEITARGLLSHTSGLPDVSDYGWHDPQLGDDALSDFARRLSPWQLRAQPGVAYSYSNAGFELLGLLLARATGTTFEEAVRRVVLDPLGMRTSTFLRAEVPTRLAASPHVGRPLTVPGDAYPYSRRHAPSSTLHSHVDDMGRWMLALLEPSHLDPAVLEQMWRSVVPVGDPPWDEAAGLGWAVGAHLGHRAVSHSGADPGFGSRLVLLPGRRTGVVVLANSNTVPTWAVVEAALDIALDDPAGDGVSALRSEVARLVGPAGRATHELDDDDLEKAVWGAIELHRTDLAWPLLRGWADVRPKSPVLREMTDWAHRVDEDPAPG
ncbi:serine hydrolase domain-containing protein [Nocardioides terrigena]|uniref:serine hydrolase domain-containing protein n=1 Tax=Nocardioides terrigena TaxID=424797 RepID=UPI000D2FA519|nr:serine hydrolase domain-containing protein [Nocardioides terrigena]